MNSLATHSLARTSAVLSLTRLIEADADLLSAQLQQLRSRAFPPTAEKKLRKFMAGEAAKLIGISDAYLRLLASEGNIPDAEKNGAGRRLYSLEQIHEIRRYLSVNKKGYSRNGQRARPCRLSR